MLFVKSKKEIMAEIGTILSKHEDAINNDDFTSIIMDVYLQYGAQGVETLKEILSQSGFGRQYNTSIEKIIKTLLKNSDLLD